MVVAPVNVLAPLSVCVPTPALDKESVAPTVAEMPSLSTVEVV